MSSRLQWRSALKMQFESMLLWRSRSQLSSPCLSRLQWRSVLKMQFESTLR